MKFPALTFCNMNPIDKSALSSSSKYDIWNFTFRQTNLYITQFMERINIKCISDEGLLEGRFVVLSQIRITFCRLYVQF